MIAEGDWITIGAPVNESEIRAFATLRSELEKSAERFTVASNIRLLNGRADFFEYDAIVVGERMIFAIEIKGYGGRIECQRDRWYLSSDDYVENPGGRISMKAKQLKSLLIGRDRGLRDNLWVQDFVYVNGIGAKLIDADYARRSSYDVLGNTTFDNAEALGRALRESPRWFRGEPFTPDQRERIVEYLRGGKPRKVADRIGPYLILESLIATSERYERLLARNRFAPNDADRAELHVYRLDGRATQSEELERQFKRQIQTVTQLGNLGVVPRFLEAGENSWYDERVTYIAYEWLGGLESLGDRIGRTEPSLRESLKLAIALADSIATMHEQGIVHGALEPSSLFLRPDAETGDARLVIGRIELARPRDAGMSVGPKSAVNTAASTYASPDVLENKHPDVDDDLFSFGAILVQILRGRPMFAAPKEILQKIRIPRLVDNASADPPDLVELVKSLLARSRMSRPGSMRAVATQLRALLAPLQARREDPRKIGNYTILRELRAGATGRTVVAERVDRAGEVVLKIAEIGKDESVRHEIETLRELQQHGPQAHIVLAYDVVTIPEAGKTVGEFMYVRGEDGERLRGKIVRAALAPLADSLFSALAAIHERGLVHRDVKPANLMMGEDGTATLIDFGLASKSGDRDFVVGTAPYKSERLFEREAWTPSDDVFAAAATIWEIATAQHPWNGESPSGEPHLDLEALGTLVDDAVKPAFAAAIRDLLTRDDTTPGAASRARAAIASVLRTEKPVLELALPIIIELPEHTTLLHALANIQLGKTTRRALDDLGATTLDDVLGLDNARFSSIRAYGRGVTDEIAALRLALVRRFGEPTESTKSTLRSVRRAFAPALVTDPEAIGAPLDVLGISAHLRAALERHTIQTVAALAGADPTNLERDERIGTAGVSELRDRIQRYADDREGLVVDAVMPAWAAAIESDFIDDVARMGGSAAGAIDLLERAGGFVVKPDAEIPLRRALVAAPPWTYDGFIAALRALADTAAWPPCDLAMLAGAMEAPDAVDTDARAFFVERLAPALSRIKVTADARYYAPEAASLADFLAYGAQTVALPAPLGAFVSAVEKRLNGLRLPSAATDEFARALEDAGFSLVGGAVERTAALVREREREATSLGGADVMALSSVARALVESTSVGGYRLVVAEPAFYAARTRSLVNELRTTLGDRLRFVDLDAELYRLLKERNRLQTAIVVQRKAGLRDDALAPIAGEMTRGVLDTLLDGKPNTMTILINAGSLGLTGAAQHLGRIYDAARGQSRGLVVVCVPGDHPNDHARLNRIVPLPIQPTERPMALDGAA